MLMLGQHPSHWDSDLLNQGLLDTLMTQEELPAKRPRGLGAKEKTPPVINEKEHPEGECFFALDEDKEPSLLEMIAVMLRHAEASIPSFNLIEDDEEDDRLPKCVSLFRAVVHECSRIGSLKEELDEKDDPEAENDKELSEIRELILGARFYAIYADALYFVAALDPELEKSDALKLLEQAIQFYELAKEECIENRPESIVLTVKMGTVRCLIQCFGGGNNDLSEGIKELVGLKDEDDQFSAALWRIVQFQENMLRHAKGGPGSGSDTCLTVFRTLQTEELSAKKLDAVLCEQISHVAFIILESHLDHSDSSGIELCVCLIAFLKAQLSMINCAKDSDERDDYIELSKALSQAYIWDGCFCEAFDERVDQVEVDAQQSYNLAVAVYRDLNERFEVEIPKDILDLEIE